MRSGNCFINGEHCPREAAGGGYVVDDDGVHVVLQLYLEILPGDVNDEVLKATDAGEANNTPEDLVPPDHLFMMGDNPHDSPFVRPV